MVFFFNDTATTEIYTLSLHDALPISWSAAGTALGGECFTAPDPGGGNALEVEGAGSTGQRPHGSGAARSEEHTSELQSRQYLVCRLLLEKKKEQTSDFLASQHLVFRS